MIMMMMVMRWRHAKLRDRVLVELVQLLSLHERVDPMAQPQAPRGATMLAVRTPPQLAAPSDPPDERPAMITLFKDALSTTVDVLQAHFELAVLEIREDAKVGARVAIVCSVGGALAFLALAFGLAGATFALALAMPAWAACLAVASVTATAAGLVLARGRRLLRKHAFGEQSTLALQESEP
jgi:uncharacterized membrane protein YqjE